MGLAGEEGAEIAEHAHIAVVARVLDVRQLVPPRPARARLKPVPVPQAVGTLGAPDRKLDLVGAGPAGAAGHRNRHPTAVQARQEVGLAELWVGRIAHRGVDQLGRAEQALDQVDEVGEDLAHIAALGALGQPGRILLPVARPARKVQAQLGAGDGAERAVLERRVDRIGGLAVGEGEVDRVRGVRLLDRLHQCAALGQVDAERLLAEHGLAGRNRGPCVLGVCAGRAGDVDHLGARVGGHLGRGLDQG